MIETENKAERVLLVGAETVENYKVFESSMEELAKLAETAGALVVTQTVQKLEKINPQTYVGTGKLEEIVKIVDSREIETVIFNDRLSPRQNVALEAALTVKVIDRMQLILDIFAMRARSQEGMLQVEQAQLSYLLPRLVGQGIALSRQAGGIGSRGPGESQLEIDRRHIRQRIEDIQRKLKRLESSRKLMRKKRQKSGIFKIGLIGYTNAGKSSMLNALVSEDKQQYEKNELFATLDATTKVVKLKDEFAVSLTDTVGFIQNLPTELIQAFKSTLEEATDVDLLVHVIDASSPYHVLHEKTVGQIIRDLGADELPVLNIYNKMDLVSSDFIPSAHPSVRLSIKSETGAEDLRHVILDRLYQLFEAVDFELNYAESYKLPELHQQMLIEELTEKENSYLIKGFINPKEKWRLNLIS